MKLNKKEETSFQAGLCQSLIIMAKNEQAWTYENLAEKMQMHPHNCERYSSLDRDCPSRDIRMVIFCDSVFILFQTNHK